MQIALFGAGTLRFAEQVPESVPADGFVWIYLERESLAELAPLLQRAAQHLGGSPVLDLHLQDLANAQHPSRYDYTSVYDLVIFRRLATEQETRAETTQGHPLPGGPLAAFQRIRSRAVGFVVFDRLLISVHPAGCQAAQTFVQRFLSDALQSEGLGAGARTRLPASPSDLMLRMLNMMVDSYLELRKDLSTELDAWQLDLLAPGNRTADWRAFMSARTALHTLEDLCEGQHDAMQEWLDAQREQPPNGVPQAERDGLLARSRDVVEHIQRVTQHVRRMEQGAETAVQIHFSAVGHRANEIMRVLTALTAVFLPLNFITGFFGMNFEFLPLIHSALAMWVMLGLMALVSISLVAVFWRKRYLARTGR
ncbi:MULTISPECIES: magnesium transporter CorA family protein [Ramlibacter]|uniref:Magnesium transporter CorA family protein n=1 Tax=Ramlibacter aquaticus TaxID=2780094 RepID=A0ABR9SH25_9BURK|nr:MULTISPECIES: magnesium transporter CorA family protein [Ramlibacter]MBE7941656.1 magnesium transporter CorA family protein [Ramlibacter aquaticus]